MKPIPTPQSTIEQGQRALQLLPHVTAFSDEQSHRIVSELVSHYKGSQLTTEMLWAAVGKFALLSDLRASIEHKVRAMTNANARELHPNDPPDRSGESESP